MSINTQLFNEVTTEFTGGNDLYLGTLDSATASINPLLQVETVKSPGLGGVSMYFVTSPYTLAGKSIAMLKKEFQGTIQEVRLVPSEVPGQMRTVSGDVYSVDGNYFAAWLETSSIASVKVSAWLNEY